MGGCQSGQGDLDGCPDILPGIESGADLDQDEAVSPTLYATSSFASAENIIGAKRAVIEQGLKSAMDGRKRVSARAAGGKQQGEAQAPVQQSENRPGDHRAWNLKGGGGWSPVLLPAFRREIPSGGRHSRATGNAAVGQK